MLLDDFEGCSGTCGWTISNGSASVVSTILPGEHGLEIDGGATATKSVSPITIDDTYSLQLVADCPAGLDATLTVSTPSKPSVKVSVMLAIDDSLDSSGNAPDYTSVTYVPLIGDIVLPKGVTSAVIHGIELSPAAGSPCTVDLIRVTSVPPCGSS